MLSGNNSMPQLGSSTVVRQYSAISKKHIILQDLKITLNSKIAEDRKELLWFRQQSF